VTWDTSGHEDHRTTIPVPTADDPLVTFLIVYTIVFGFGSYYLAKLLRKGPDPVEQIPRPEDPGKKPKRPFSLPDENLEGGPGYKGPAPQPAE
jgi:cytochrome bd ubiquinol oxidase subunit I